MPMRLIKYFKRYCKYHLAKKKTNNPSYILQNELTNTTCIANISKL